MVAGTKTGTKKHHTQNHYLNSGIASGYGIVPLALLFSMASASWVTGLRRRAIPGEGTCACGVSFFSGAFTSCHHTSTNKNSQEHGCFAATSKPTTAIITSTTTVIRTRAAAMAATEQQKQKQKQQNQQQKQSQ